MTSYSQTFIESETELDTVPKGTNKLAAQVSPTFQHEIDTQGHDIARTFTETETESDVQGKAGGRVFTEVETESDASSYFGRYIVKYIRTDGTNVENDIRTYLNANLPVKANLAQIAIYGISSDNLGVLIVSA